MDAATTQAEFEAQWRPIPADDFPLPACPEGMILLKAFSDAHPHSFEFIRPEDFVHYEMRCLRGSGSGTDSPITVSRVVPVTNFRSWRRSPCVVATAVSQTSSRSPKLFM